MSYKCLLTPFAVILEILMMACIPYLAVDTACLIEPAQMFAPKTTKIFYALVFESELQVVVMFIYWVSACIEARHGVFLCEVVICVVSFFCFMNIPVALSSTCYITRNSVKSAMFEAIERFTQDYTLAKGMDYIQSAWQCCGVFQWRDWARNPFFNCTYSLSPFCRNTPASCQQYGALKLSDYCSNLMFQHNLKNVSHSVVLMDGPFLQGCINLAETYQYVSGHMLVKYSLLVSVIPLLLVGLQKFMKKISSSPSKDTTSKTQTEVSPSFIFNDLLKTEKIDDKKFHAEYLID